MSGTRKLATYAPRAEILAVNPKAFGLDFLVQSFTPDEPYEMCGAYAVVCIEGPLTHRDTWMFDSYDCIRDRMLAAFDSKAEAVVMKVDSPGGDVAGCFELARELRKMSEEKGIPLIAFADGQMCSAAYALSCGAQRIYAAPTSMVGSIGVIEAIIDATAADAAMGVRWTFAMSGERKADGNPHVPLTKEAFAAKQANVDALAQVFFGLVEELRGVPANEVAALQAGIFFGETVMATQLADAIMTWPELVSGQVNAGEIMAKAEEKPSPDMLAGLSKAAEGDDETAKRARRALRAFYAENKEGEDEPESKKAEGEEKPPMKEEARAEGEEPESKKTKATAPVTALGDVTAKLAAELASIKAERAADKDAKARAEIFATRPDLGKDAVASLAGVPTNGLAAVVAAYPRAASPAAAAQAMGTQGAGQANGEASYVPPEEAARIDAAMGLGRATAFVGAKGNDLELGLLTNEQARAHLAKLEGTSK